MLKHYIVFCYTIFIRWKEPYRPPYVYFLGRTGERIYQSPVVITIFTGFFLLFSLMNVFILLESNPKYYFGLGILSFFVLQMSFFSVVRYYSNTQHINAHVKLISLYPLSYSKKYFLYYIGEFIAPNFLAVLALGIPFTIYCECGFLVKMKMLFAIIFFHIFLSTLSIIIPRNKITSTSFITAAIMLFLVDFQLILAIADNKALKGLNEIMRYIFGNYYFFFFVIVMLFLCMTYSLKEKLLRIK